MTAPRRLASAFLFVFVFGAFAIDLIIEPWWGGPGIVAAIGIAVIAAPDKHGAAVRWAVPVGSFMLGYSFARIVAGLFGGGP